MNQPWSRLKRVAAGCLLALSLGVQPIPSAAQSCMPTVAVESPEPGQLVGGMVTLKGWAVDLSAPGGSGIDAVRVYVGGLAEAGGIGIGVATIGLARPDVDEAYGLVDTNAGWQLEVDLASLSAVDLARLMPGTQTVYVYAHTMCGWSYVAHNLAIEAPPAPSFPVAAPPAPPAATVPQTTTSPTASSPAPSYSTAPSVGVTSPSTTAPSASYGATTPPGMSGYSTRPSDGMTGPSSYSYGNTEIGRAHV